MTAAPSRYTSLPELARARQDGVVRAEEILEHAIERHHAYGDRLNAYAVWAEDTARSLARAADAAAAAGIGLGPLQGIPISVKDCFGVTGLPTFAGSARRLPSRWEAEGTIVGAIRRQAGILVGKTVQTEFALGATGVNPYGDQPRNPWDGQGLRSAGGSSTGAGVSLLEGSAMLAFGTDTLGSVRIPASATGTVGFKPSVGFWPTDGVVPLSPTLDTIGLLGLGVADVAYGVRALWPGSPGSEHSTGRLSLSDFRIGVANAPWPGCTPSIADVVTAALDELGRAGARIEPIALPEADEAYDLVLEGAIAVAEFDAFLAAELPEWRDLLLPGTATLAERGRRALARQYLVDRQRHSALCARAGARFETVTVLAAPTLPVTPPRLDRPGTDDERRQLHLAMLRHSCVASCLNLCAITLPVGLDAEGIPVGLELLAPAGVELYLLAVAEAVERELGSARDRLGHPELLAKSMDSL